ncbi:PorT family protein [bacterium]|nr:PorT family protein [bacterium]
MRLRILPLAMALALTVPALAAAETVYFKKAGETGIQSVSGRIVKENSRTVDVETEDGHVVSISRSKVFQIIRNEGAADEPVSFHSLKTSGSGATRMGLKGGMNIANMSVDPVELEDENSLTAFSVGAWWRIPLRGNFSVQPEALYSVKGDAQSGDGYSTSTQLAYIDVPVLARIGFLHGSPYQPSLYAGPLLAMNVSASAKVEGDGGDVALDVKDQVNTFDFGMVVGGGLDFEFGSHTYGVDVRYSKGLSNLAGEGANGTGHNDVLTVMGSIGFQ